MGGGADPVVGLQDRPKGDSDKLLDRQYKGSIKQTYTYRIGVISQHIPALLRHTVPSDPQYKTESNSN